MTDGEQEELDDLSPEYLFATEYLARHEIGLAPSREELTAREEQVILYVAGERIKARREMQEQGPASEADKQFQEEAEPEEVEVSDAELLRLANRGRRGRH